MTTTTREPWLIGSGQLVGRRLNDDNGDRGRSLGSAPVTEAQTSDEGWITVGPGPIHFCFHRAAPGSPGAGVPPLVFLHDGLGSIGLWRSFPDDVRRALGGPTTLVYSRHGYGRSAVMTEPRTVGYMHDEALDVLPAVLAHFGLDRPVLVGHSDGASIAIIHAGVGHRVAGLVLLAPHVFVEPCTIDSIAEARTAFATTDLPIRLSRHHDNPVATFRGWNDVWLSPDFRSWNIESFLPGITAPTLLIQGDRDQYGTLAQLDAIERSVRGQTARYVVEAAAHAPHVEAPRPTVEAVARFVGSLRP